MGETYEADTARLEFVNRASQGGILREQVFTAFIGEAAREDFIPYTADFFLQLEDVKWTIVAGGRSSGGTVFSPTMRVSAWYPVRNDARSGMGRPPVGRPSRIRPPMRSGTWATKTSRPIVV